MPQSRRGAISVNRGEELERVIFRGRRKRMDRRALHVTLEPILREWIRAACMWDTLSLGDYRFVVFSIDVAPATEVYVKFWSEALEPVMWEVSSGKWNPPADEWLAGERAARIEALGLTIGGDAENYHREIDIQTPAQIAVVAKQVVRILCEGFDYRGLQPIVAKLVYEGRARTTETYDAFTVEEVSTVFATRGYRIEQWVPEEGDEPGPPRIRCRKRGLSTIVHFWDPIEDEDLFTRVRFEADVPLPQEERQRMLKAPDAPEGAEPYVTVSVVHTFTGGVTVEWLIARIVEWDGVLREHGRMARKDRSRGRVAHAPAETVH
jgi:hypothetical protein